MSWNATTPVQMRVCVSRQEFSGTLPATSRRSNVDRTLPRPNIVKYASDCEGGSNTCARKLVRLDGKSRETGQEHAGSRLLIGSWRRHSMYCPLCGKETPDGAIFCPACGAKLTSGKMERNPKLGMDGKWKTEPDQGRRTVEPKVQIPRSPKKQAASYFLLYIIIIYCGLVFANMEGWISLPHISFPGSGSNPSVPSVAKTVPSAAKQSYLQGIQYMNSSSYSKALESYETAIQTYSNYSDAWNGKGEALESLGRGAEALTCFQTAVQIDPQACPAWINEGEVLESLGRYDEAMSCYNKALQSEPSNEAAIQNKEELLDRGISDNAAPPPTKQYDQTHPLRVTGGLAEGSMLVIHIKEGEDFQTTLAVESGQPPYYWYLVTTNGVADSILFESAGDGSVVTVRGRGAYINDPTTTKRQALVNLRVEDSSQLTRSSKPNFQVIVDNTDDSAIAAQVARKWYQNNVGDLNGTLQQATAGLGYGTATVSYSSPIRRADGYYQVTVTLTMNVGADGYGVHISLPCILTIDTKSEKVTNVLYGDAKTSY